MSCAGPRSRTASGYAVRFARWFMLTLTLLIMSALVAQATTALGAGDSLEGSRQRFTKLIHNLIPLGNTGIDLTPFIIMASMLIVAGIMTWYRPKEQWARRTVQTISAVAFIIGIHPCGCMTRDLVIGIGNLGVNDLDAFRYLMVFVTAGAFAAVLGRGFCGWVCPLGYVQEVMGGITQRYWRHVHNGKVFAAWWRAMIFLAAILLVYVFLIALGEPGSLLEAMQKMLISQEFLIISCTTFAVFTLLIVIAALFKSITAVKYISCVCILASIIYAFYRTKPGTYSVIEYAMVFFVMGLSLIVLTIVTDEHKDRFFKKLRVFIWLAILAMYLYSFYNVGPMCLFFQGSREWPVLISFGAVFILSTILIMPWCRYMCPEGTAFGLLARRAAWQINRTDACTECGACDLACPMHCIEKGIRDKTSCIACNSCITVCPENALVVENEIFPKAAPERIAANEPLPDTRPATEESK